MKHHFLAIHAMGAHSAGLLTLLSHACTQSGCLMVESRWSLLGELFSFSGLLRGTWGAIAKLEAALPTLEKRTETVITVKRTQLASSITNRIPYSIQVIALQSANVLSEAVSFLEGEGAQIEDLHLSPYVAPRTGAAMLVLSITISIPDGIHLSTLRDNFIVYCEERNLDAAMEPYKH